MKKLLFLFMFLILLFPVASIADTPPFGMGPFNNYGNFIGGISVGGDIEVGTNSIDGDSSAGLGFDSDNDGTNDVTFPAAGGVEVGGTNERITGNTYAEYIDFSTDTMICMGGSGGSNNEDLCFDFDTSSDRIDVLTNTGAYHLRFDNIGILIRDDLGLNLGSSGTDAEFIWETSSSQDLLQLSLSVGSSAQSGYFIIIENGEENNANRAPTASWANGTYTSDPTFCVSSSDGDAPLDHGCIWHDQSNFNIGWGAGNLEFTQPNEVPDLSSCGTSPTISGNSAAGKVTVGAGTITSCTITFDTAFSNAPSCIVEGDNNAIGYATTTTTAAMTITSSADMNSDVISYICIGY